MKKGAEKLGEYSALIKEKDAIIKQVGDAESFPSGATVCGAAPLRTALSSIRQPILSSLSSLRSVPLR